MSTSSGPNDSRRALREQITEDRQELAETVTALRNKTDIKGRVREKTADVEIAVTDVAGRAGRTLGFVPGFARWALTSAADGVRNKVPSPVRAPIEQAVGLMRREARTIVAALAVMTVMEMRRRCGPSV